MYFWKINQLKEDIQSGNLSESNIFIYAYIYLVLSAAGMEMMLWLPEIPGNIWDTASSVSNILIVSIGTVFAYKANGAGSGNNFLARYFSIGFVVTVRFLALLIPLMILLMLYYFYAFDIEEEITTTVWDFLPFLIWYVALYWRICKHISDLNKS